MKCLPFDKNRVIHKHVHDITLGGWSQCLLCVLWRTVACCSLIWINLYQKLWAFFYLCFHGPVCSKGQFHRNRSVKLYAGQPLCSVSHLSPESFGEEILFDFPKCDTGIIPHPLTPGGQSQMKV